MIIVLSEGEGDGELLVLKFTCTDLVRTRYIKIKR
jgi:hypothetical protein